LSRESTQNNAIANDEHLTALRNAILRAFPDVVYAGKITRHDGMWLPELTEENAIHDNDKFLYEALNGRKWSDIPLELLYEMPGDFVLLTNDALVAFMAAWLMCSLENPVGANDVREYFVYTFGKKDQTQTKDFSISLLRAFNPEQLAVLRLLLVEFSQSESSGFVREYAHDAVKLIDGLNIGTEQ
jgi:hypothetical protein